MFTPLQFSYSGIIVLVYSKYTTHRGESDASQYPKGLPYHSLTRDDLFEALSMNSWLLPEVYQAPPSVVDSKSHVFVLFDQRNIMHPKINSLSFSPLHMTHLSGQARLGYCFLSIYKAKNQKCVRFCQTICLAFKLSTKFMLQIWNLLCISWEHVYFRQVCVCVL